MAPLHFISCIIKPGLNYHLYWDPCGALFETWYRCWRTLHHWGWWLSAGCYARVSVRVLYNMDEMRDTHAMLILICFDVTIMADARMNPSPSPGWLICLWGNHDCPGPVAVWVRPGGTWLGSIDFKPHWGTTRVRDLLCSQQIGIHEVPPCVLLLLEILCASTKWTFVLMLSTWCVFRVWLRFICVWFKITSGLGVFTLS